MDGFLYNPGDRKNDLVQPKSRCPKEKFDKSEYIKFKR